MIKFFRKIRQKLLSENKFTKYLLYAIGEIVLVVVGILIALYINNRNQKQQELKKIDAILAEVMDEIELNIEETNKLMKFYKEKDSMAAIVLSSGKHFKPFNQEVINEKSARILWALPTVTEQVFFTDKAFVNLTNNANLIPEKYKNTYTKLYELYIRNQTSVMALNEEMRNNGISNVKEREQFEWYSHTSSELNNEGFIDYVLNDYRYKNKVRIVLTDGINRHLKSAVKYRDKALTCFNELKTLLNKSDKNTRNKINQNTIEFVLGKWKTTGPVNIIFEVYLEEDRLFVNSSNSDSKTELIQLSEFGNNFIAIEPNNIYYLTLKQVGEKIEFTNKFMSIMLEKTN